MMYTLKEILEDARLARNIREHMLIIGLDKERIQETLSALRNSNLWGTKAGTYLWECLDAIIILYNRG
jgi:hypothetical protein